MNLNRFLLLRQYAQDRPENVSSGRWQAMLRWLERRKELDEPLEFPEEDDDEE